MARHQERSRAESFGGWAEAYDQHRETYPDELIDHLIASAQPTEVLDVGCGTGKLGSLFVARGLPVTGIEPDARMAEVARNNGLDVEVSPFETWDRADRTFDLIVAGTSWHWVEPIAGAAMAAAALNPGGLLGLTWHFPSREPGIDAAINAVYAAHAPEVEAGTPQTDMEAIITPLLSGPWTDAGNASFAWSQSYTADEWIDYLDTTSVHKILPDDVQRAVYDGNRQAIADHGGTITIDFSTLVLTARRG